MSKSPSENETSYLIADLHLQEERPETTQLFLDFLDGPARAAGGLYILGDLFEVWIGDDAPGRLGRDVAARLSRLSQSGTSIYFICGNRDFLLGDRFCHEAGMTRLEEPELICHGGGSILLLHGDTLCTDDESYQRFRRKSRNPDWQQRMLSKPVWLRQLMARLARWASRRHTGSTQAGIMDVNQETVAEAFRHHGVRRMIHGHTHRCAIHDLTLYGHDRHDDHGDDPPRADRAGSQRHCQRIVLGDWHKTGTAVCLDSQLRMMTIARNERGSVELQPLETAAEPGAASFSTCSDGGRRRRR